MIESDTLDQLLSRYSGLESRMAEAGAMSPDAFAKLSKEYSDLGPAVEKARQLKKMRGEAADLEQILEDGSADADMKELAEAELDDLHGKLPVLEHELQLLLLPKDDADEKNAILEIRAGTGGEEAALFAADLFRMYQRYAEEQGWKVEIISASESAVGGYKEIIATVSGAGVFAKLKFESGVHRVQRVPVTEAGGRIHTSAATVAVLPEAEEVDVNIDDKDLRVDVFRASGAGGQHVNKTESAVRITHLPTGLAVSQQDEKSQHKNRAKAMKILRARLYEMERAARDAERASARKSQVGSGDRSERIRTYNYPQNRVTDHRINLTLHKLELMMQGVGLDELFDALVSAEQAEQLAELDAANA